MAPYYLDGVSDPKDWANQLQHPAPWGEIGSRKLAIASSKQYLKDYVSDPTKVVEFYDAVRHACHCGGHPRHTQPLVACGVHHGEHVGYPSCRYGMGACVTQIALQNKHIHPWKGEWQ